MNPVLVECFGMSVPEQFNGIDKEREYLEDLALCDISALPKLGIKGEGSTQWLEEQGIEVPQEIYQWLGLLDKGLVVRLDRDEYFLEEGFEGVTVRRLYDLLGEGTGGSFRLNRQDAGLFLCGRRAHEVLRQSCSFDFSNGGSDLIMTQVVGISCAILPLTVGCASGFRIWLIPSYAIYLWGALFEIVKACNGHAVGMGCLGDPTNPA